MSRNDLLNSGFGDSLGRALSEMRGLILRRIESDSLTGIPLQRQM